MSAITLRVSLWAIICPLLLPTLRAGNSPVYQPLSVPFSVPDDIASHPERQTLDPGHEVDAISLSAREYWMRRAIDVLAEHASPCPFAAFGAVVVNHTQTHTDLTSASTSLSLGGLICDGVNSAVQEGDPTLHGEMVAIKQCAEVLQGPGFGLSPREAIAALRDLTLYTTAEPCPMCASAIRWAGFRECVYGTSLKTLVRFGWRQIGVSSAEIFSRSSTLGTRTALLGGVLRLETDPLFAWQFDPDAPCPGKCTRSDDGRCVEAGS
jgi:tRNA(Arg) A34 adenosine deaminase TadA